MAISSEAISALCDDDTVTSLFRRMTELGREPEASIRALALWLWMETSDNNNGRCAPNLLTTIAHRSDKELKLVANEADVVIAFLMSSGMEDINNAMSSSNVLRDIYSQFPLKDMIRKRGRESVAKDIREICEMGPCRDLPEGVMNKERIEVVEEGRPSSDFGGGSGLNAEAEAWSPEIGRAPEEKLCLYLTFSKGYPISANQLVNFFTRRFGPCVERVYVHAPPLFGKIHFTVSYVPALILNGEDEVRLTVGGRFVSCKRFAAENRRKNGTSTSPRRRSNEMKYLPS